MWSSSFSEVVQDTHFFLVFLVSRLKRESSLLHHGIRPAVEWDEKSNLLERALRVMSSTIKLTASSMQDGVADLSVTIGGGFRFFKLARSISWNLSLSKFCRGGKKLKTRADLADRRMEHASSKEMNGWSESDGISGKCQLLTSTALPTKVTSIKLVSAGANGRESAGKLHTFSGNRAKRDSSSRPRAFEQLLFQSGLFAFVSAPMIARVRSELEKDRMGSSSVSKEGREGRR